MDILDALETLRVLLNNSGIERTTGLRKRMGSDCSYFRKSRDLFLSRDYDRIVAQLAVVSAQLTIMGGPKQ